MSCALFSGYTLSNVFDDARGKNFQKKEAEFKNKTRNINSKMNSLRNNISKKSKDIKEAENSISAINKKVDQIKNKILTSIKQQESRLNIIQTKNGTTFKIINETDKLSSNTSDYGDIELLYYKERKFNAKAETIFHLHSSFQKTLSESSNDEMLPKWITYLEENESQKKLIKKFKNKVNENVLYNLQGLIEAPSLYDSTNEKVFSQLEADLTQDEYQKLVIKTRNLNKNLKEINSTWNNFIKDGYSFINNRYTLLREYVEKF